MSTFYPHCLDPSSILSPLFGPFIYFIPALPWPFLLDQPGSLIRQILSLYIILILGGTLLYLFLSSLSYFLFFILWRSKYHPPTDPQPFAGQELQEIRMALHSIPTMAHLSLVFFLGEINGYSKLYNTVNQYGWPYFIVSFILFLLFSDTLIFWIHRGLHEIPWLYKNIHKDHHKWKVPTPFAGIAFHPLDGWAQSLPYHIFPYLFPMQKWLCLGAFVGVQAWAVLIHDGVHWTPFEFVNGAAHHTLHHSKFYYNYGQFFTFWDRLARTHMNPFLVYDREKKEYVEMEKDGQE